MNRFLIVILSILLSIISLYSQEDYSHTLDSITKNKTLVEQFNTVAKEVEKYNSEKLNIRLFYSRALLEIAKKSKDDNLLGRAYYQLAYSYEIIGQYDLAIEACYKGLDYLEKVDNKYLVGMIYNEIGLIYSSRNNPDELDIAIKYFKKFLKIQIERKDTGEIAGAYSNIGWMYNYKGMHDSAYYYSKLALNLRKKINQERTIPISLGNVGLSFYYLGEKDSALYYFKQAEEKYLQSGNLYGLSETYRDFIIYYLDKKDFAHAKEYIDKSLENSKKIKSGLLTAEAHYSQYEYYKAVGDYQNALKYFEIYKSISDSLNSNSVKNRIANIEAVYSLEKKEREIELYKEREKSQKQIAENRKQRLIYLAVLSVLLVIVFVIITYSLVRKRKQEKELNKMKLEKSKLKEQELNTKLEYKSKQLTSHALNMMKKNKFLQELEVDISEIRKEANDEVKAKLRRLNSLIKQNNKSDKDWELFKNYFEEVNMGFYERLQARFPGLSSNDLKLSALIKLNMNIKESASVLNISPESVKTARYRLRRKLDLRADQNLYEFIQSI